MTSAHRRLETELAHDPLAVRPTALRPTVRCPTALGALALRPVCLAIGLLGLHLAAHALPAGAQTVAGQVAVQAPGAGQLKIQQSSDKAIVDWKSFSIGAGERVLVNQPSVQSVLLNRVVGGEPSLLLGQLQANGQVFLVNPRGIVFGKGSQVDAGGFLASTLGITDDAFLSGRYAFTAGSETPGSLSADGRISAPGGTVALVAPVLSVAGEVAAHRIGLASASSVRVDVEGDGLVLFDARNDGLASRLDLLGRLRAEGGGSVELRAQARAGFADTVLNLDGVVQARSLGSRDGRIVIDGGTAGGTRIAGTLDATGAAPGERGGSISLLGAQLALTDAAVVDVSGAAGGGTALVGGGLHGLGTDHTATDTQVAAGAVLRADAGIAGDGGTVVVWSDRSTRFSGRVSARGGSEGGNGGFAEVSGKQQLDFGGSVDLRPGAAGGGQKGTLLLDPMDLLIGSTADIAGDGSAQDLTTPSVAYDQNPGAVSRITAAQVAHQLDGADVRLEATHDITVQTAIDASGNAGGGSLALVAGNDVHVQANITTRGGDLTLLANHGFGAASASGTGAVDIAAGVQLSTRGAGQTTGSISASGATSTFGIGSALLAGQDVSLTATAAGLALAGIDAGGQISVQAHGSISQTGALSVGADGSSFTASGSGSAIDLSTSANAFGGKTVALQSTGDAAIAGDALLLATSTIGGKLTATATTGAIAQTGAITVGADGSSFTTTGGGQAIDLSTSANAFGGKTVALQSTGDAAIAGDALLLATSTIGGKLTATATTGAIAQTGAITVGADGSSFTTLGSGQAIDLSTSANAFGGKTVALQSTGDAAIAGDALRFASSTIGGKLTATAATGTIAQTGAITVGADGSSFTTTGSSQAIDLSTSANLFNGKTIALQSTGDAAVAGDALLLATSTIGGKLTATATTGAIAQTGAITVGADGSSFTTTGSGSAIDLSTSANLFNGKTIALQSTGDAAIAGDALRFATSTIGGKLTATASSGTIAQTGAITVGADGSSFTTTGGGQAIDLSTSANLFNGKTIALQSTGDAAVAGDALRFATSTIGGKLTATASSGTIAQTGAITVGADGSSFTTLGSSRAIDLSTSANLFNGKTVALKSTGDAAVAGDALRFATSTIGGKLTATATTGAIAQTGAITVGADGSSFTTTGGGQAIDLSTSVNAFGGRTVALNAAGDAAVTGDSLTLAASSIGGRLTATATTGSLTQTGILSVGADGSSLATLAAGQAIDLSTQANQFAGHSIALQSAGSAAIRGDALTFAASTLAGRLTATATAGNIGQTGPLSFGAEGNSFITSAPGASIDLSSQVNVFLGHGVTFQTIGSGGNAAVRADRLVFDASTLGGRLVATATEGGIGQTGAIAVGADGSSFSTTAPGQAIVLANAGNAFNGKTVALQSTGDATLVGDALVLAASSIGGRLAATSILGDLTQTGPLTTGADGSSFTTVASGRSVLLANAGNLFNGHALSFQTTGAGGDVTVTGNGLVFGASAIGGKLVATATSGDIAQTGAIAVGADGNRFSTNGAGRSIALDSAANLFAGRTIALQTSGNAAVRGDALTFATSTVGGRLLATSTGALAQTGPLTVGGAATLNVGGSGAGAPPASLVLDNPGNDFASVQVSSPGAGSGIAGATLVDRNDLTVGGGPGSGAIADLNARAGGSLTLAGGSFGSLEASAQTGILQSAALTVTGPTALTGAPGMAIDLATGGAGNRLQTLTLATSGAGRLGAVQVANATDLAVGGDAASLQASAGGNLTLTGGRYGSLSVDTSAANGAVNQTGSLQVTGATRVAAGSGAVTLADPANDFTVFALAGAGTARLADANDLTVGDSFLAGRWELTLPGSLRFSGLLSGTGSLALTGTGTALIDTAQTYTGGTFVLGGILALDGAAAQAGAGGTITVGAAGRLDLRNGASVANPVTSLGGMIADSSGAASITGPVSLQGSDTRIDVAAASALTISSMIGDGGAGIGLVKTGEGTLTLNTSNTFTGPTRISAGTVIISDTGSSTLDVASPVIVAAGTNLVLTQNQTLGPLTGTGSIFLGSFSLGIGAGTASTSQADFGGSIAGSGSISKLGQGLQILSGVNSYTGTTRVIAGTLQLAGGSAIADTGGVDIAAGARIGLASSETIGSLSGAGGVQLGAQRLTTGANGLDSVFSGAIDGSGGLSKVGPGRLLLNGSNSYTGDTLVAAGSLQLGSSTALSSVTALAVAAGAEVDLAAPVRIGSLSGAGQLALKGQALTTGGDQRDTVFTGSLTGAGSLTKNGGGNFTLGGSNLYTGPTTVAGGSLTALTALPASTDFSVASGAVLNLGTDLAFASIAGNGRIALNGHGLAVGASNADSAFDGGIEGAGSLRKLGSGSLVLGGLNTYAGSTSIEGGTLAVGAADTGGGSGRGTLGSGTVTNNATLRFQRSDALTIDNPIAGSGQLVVAGGSVTLTNAANSYTGATLVQGGELRTSAAERLPDASAVQVNAGARLSLAGAETVASISADGDVAVQGDVTTAGSQTYRGSLTVQAAGGMRFTATSLDAEGAGNLLGSQPISIVANTARLTASQDLLLGDLQLANGGQITAPKLGLAGKLDLAQGRLALTATAAPDPAAAVADSMARVPGTGRPLAIAETTVVQAAGSAITVAAGAQLDIAATGGGSVLLAQDANSFIGGLSVLSGPAFNTAWVPNVQGAVAIQSQVQLAGGVVNVGGAGIEADVVNIRADRLATTGSAALVARLPFDNITLGTSASLPSMLLELAPAAFQTSLPFGSSLTGISVQIGSRMTGDRSTGMDAGYLTVRPKNGAQGATAVFLSGPNSSASIGGYRFFQDGAGRQSEIPVFYNNVLPQTPQVSGALSSVAAVAEAARKERFEETVRTENVAVRLRSGVIAEVGPGRPATVGTESARPPVTCAPNKPNALTCD